MSRLDFVQKAILKMKTPIEELQTALLRRENDESNLTNQITIYVHSN